MRLKDIKTIEDLMAVGELWHKRARNLMIAFMECDDVV